MDVNHMDGDFTIFGITKDPILVHHKISEQLGVTPRVIELAADTYLFFYTTYGDVAETEEMVVLKLGLLHSQELLPISAKSLLSQQLITPGSVEASKLRGSALVACFSKTSPDFCVYKTVMSMPQLYFSQFDEGILCSDNSKTNLALLDQRTLNEEAVVQHFLFRFVLGRHTFFKEIERLLSGEAFFWHDGRITMRQLRDYRPEEDSPYFTQPNEQSISYLFDGISSVMGAYIADAKTAGNDVGNMLSGGVDSTIVQLAINQHILEPAQRQTFSYAMQTPRFEFEIAYAREASRDLDTSHNFYQIKPHEYGDLLVETIKSTAHPTPNEAYACKMGLAKFIKQNFPHTRYFFPANGADSSHGTSSVRKIATLERFRRIPAASFLLRGMATVINPFAVSKAHGLRDVAAMLSELNNPDSYIIPVNGVSVYSDLDTAHRCFGDEALKRAYGYRRELEALYLDSQHHAEKALMVGMVTDAYECGVVTNLIHLNQQSEQIYPFMDEEIVGLGLSFAPEIRLLKGWEVKPLLKTILRQKSLGHIAQKPKGPSVFSEDLHDWLRNGILREMVLSIERPDFMSKTDFEKLLKVPEWNPLDEPNWFLWNLLTFDIFQKHVVRMTNR